MSLYNRFRNVPEYLDFFNPVITHWPPIRLVFARLLSKSGPFTVESLIRNLEVVHMDQVVEETLSGPSVHSTVSESADIMSNELLPIPVHVKFVELPNAKAFLD
jgi:hypothetical protein